jgi:manganese transport protein
MVPAFAVVAMGYNATQSLVVSQVVLSIALPAPMIALLVLSRRRSVMGGFATGPLVSAAAAVATAVVLALNVVLLLQTFGVAIPGLAAG